MKDRLMDNKNRMLHILNAIADIERFIGDAGASEFSQNDMLSNAILMQFIIIGEAISHVEGNILEKYDYPWYKVRAFRNLIAHEYFNIKLDAVWEIIRKDLPVLKREIEKILQSEF
jgi:uncharacterized protein with HEPN domain